MLCTRIRLCERRYNSISARETPEGGIISAATTTTSLSPSSLSTLPGSSLSSSARIIQRPCIIRNLTNNCGNNSSTNNTVVGGGTGGTGDGGALSGSIVFNSSMTPRQIIEKSIAKKTIRKKPPLVVFSLGMPSGTKTLVQHNIKRDPRKLPIFCENYKQITKRSRNNNQILNKYQQDNNENFKTNNNNNDLFIRGFEIFTEQQKQKEISENSEGNGSGGGGGGDGNSTTQNSVYVPSELKIQLNDCCECIRDIYEKRKRENLRMFFNNDNENAAEHEHTECTTNFLTVNKESSGKRELLKKTGIWIKENILRNPSPRTRQIINITMNNKKNLNDK